MPQVIVDKNVMCKIPFTTLFSLPESHAPAPPHMGTATDFCYNILPDLETPEYPFHSSFFDRQPRTEDDDDMPIIQWTV